MFVDNITHVGVCSRRGLASLAISCLTAVGGSTMHANHGEVALPDGYWIGLEEQAIRPNEERTALVGRSRLGLRDISIFCSTSVGSLESLRSDLWPVTAATRSLYLPFNSSRLPVMMCTAVRSARIPLRCSFNWEGSPGCCHGGQLPAPRPFSPFTECVLMAYVRIENATADVFSSSA